MLEGDRRFIFHIDAEKIIQDTLQVFTSDKHII